MAILAGDRRVQADQREARHVVVERHLLTPTLLVVALLAPHAKLPFVRIVLLVARHAGHREFLAIDVALVARFALLGGMASPQRETRILRVIETGGLPGLRPVARLAFHTVPATVHVLDLMTGDARGRQPLVALAGMTTSADDLGMRARERELRFGMIERLDLAPRFLRVAPVAGLAQPTLVAIVLLVAIETSPRRIAKFLGRDMTAVAGNTLVRAFQIEIREGMIEHLPVELDDVGRAALVIGVTAPALAPNNVRAASVHPLLRRQIFGDRLVTRDAEPRLPAFYERFMAIGAILLQLCVSFDQWPGHHQALEDILRVADPWHTETRDEDGQHREEHFARHWATPSHLHQ